MDSEIRSCSSAGEKKESVFSPKDLRRSKEWIDNCWKDFNPRPDIASKFCTEDSGVALAPDRFEDEEKVLPPKSEVVRDLSNDGSLRRLRWISSGKKRNRRVHRVVDFTARVSSPDTRYSAFKKFIGSSHLKFDVDNCKNSSGGRSELISPFSSLLVSM
ncbi:hypothetical protein M569_16252 [Genlisea aurea]|uniref:Uncharacterized protein n=1 Tax=Genlisea aurea TaxID=192259 RepID=S8C289_9LAMI|nr:hypothetical protein M569_16252 [Genlisea aurea]